MMKRLKNTFVIHSSCSPLKVNGKLINYTYEKAEALNNQFQSVFNPTTHNTLPGIKFTVLGILKLLHDIKIHKASGLDRFLHDFANISAEPQVEIFKKSFKTSDVPRDWQTSNVVPILKKRGTLQTFELYTSFSNVYMLHNYGACNNKLIELE